MDLPMTNFTPEDLLLYLYKESTPEQTAAIGVKNLDKLLAHKEPSKALDHAVSSHAAPKKKAAAKKAK